MESKHSVVVPSLGALVVGWLMVVPKEPAICVGALDDSRFMDLLRVAKRVTQSLRRCLGPLTIFEHGPVMEREDLGCGVDHAHLHIVPLRFDVYGALHNLNRLLAESFVPTHGLGAVREHHALGRSYLYLEQDGRTPLICNHDEIPSQLFRRVIADVLKIPDLYDWRRHTFIGNVLETIEESRCAFGRQP